MEFILPNCEEFEILEDIEVFWNRPGKIRAFTIKKGFVSDGPSIPKRLRSFIPQLGPHMLPSVVHDWCYEDKVDGMTREDADLLFKDAMASMGVDWHDRGIMHRMVRWFGDNLWG